MHEAIKGNCVSVLSPVPVHGALISYAQQAKNNLKYLAEDILGDSIDISSQQNFCY